MTPPGDPLPFTVIADRLEVIGRYLAGRSVLDLGCVDSRPAKEATAQRLAHKPNLLFKQICQANPGTVGVDIDPEGVAALAEQGFRVLCQDVQTMDLGKTFQTIIAGEIIEHLENPGQFLRNMRRHLTDDGVLIVSTPNPFYSGQQWKIWTTSRPRVHEDHVNWQDPSTLCSLMRRTGLEPFEGYWIQPPRSLIKTWARLFRPYFSNNFMLLARKA